MQRSHVPLQSLRHLTGVLLLAVLAIGLTALLVSFRTPEASFEAIVKGIWTTRVETAVSGAAPWRKASIMLWYGIECRVFSQCPMQDGVVQGPIDFTPALEGRDGWLFLETEFTYRPRAIDDNLLRITEVSHLLEQRSVELVVTVVPAKANVYRDYLPDSTARIDDLLERYAAAVRYLEELGVTTADVAFEMREARRTSQDEHPLYFRTDSHWTPHGTLAAAQAVRRALLASPLVAPLIPDMPLPFHDFDAEMTTDLSAMLGKPETEPFTGFSTEADAVQRAPWRTILVGTSYSSASLGFAEALRIHLGSEVDTYAKPSVGFWTPLLAYLTTADFATNPPEVLVLEVPERALSNRYSEAELVLNALGKVSD